MRPNRFSFIAGKDVSDWVRSVQTEANVGGGKSALSAEELASRMGAFDTDPGVSPSLRQFVAYAAPWEPIPDDGLPRYPERRPSN